MLNVTVIRRGRLSQKLAVPVTEQTITARPGKYYCTVLNVFNYVHI